jgi:hypothetical protein
VNHARMWRKLAILALVGVLFQAQISACTTTAANIGMTSFNPAAAFPGWYIIGSLLGTGPCGDPNVIGDEIFQGCPETRGTATTP